MACADYLVERGELEFLRHGAWQNGILLPGKEFQALAMTDKQKDDRFDREWRAQEKARKKGEARGRQELLDEQENSRKEQGQQDLLSEQENSHEEED